MQQDFHQSIIGKFKNLVSKDKAQSNELKVNLITADGGMQSIENPRFQEINSFKLIQNEVLVALNCLANGGCFILKIFCFLNCKTISLIYLLACLFEKLSLFKPLSSKSGNSEIYLVCLNYQLDKNVRLVEKITERFKVKSTNQLDILFKKAIISVNFLNDIIDSSIFFKDHQTRTIELNIYLSNKNEKRFYSNYVKLQKKANANFRNLINLKPIKIKDQIVKEVYKFTSNDEPYFYGLKKKLIMNFDKPASYAELVKELGDTDGKLTKIQNLIKNIYIKPLKENLQNFNKFHSFDNHVKCLEQFITQPKHLSESTRSYLNSKLCCSPLIKLSTDFEKLFKTVSYDHLDEKIRLNEDSMVEQFKILIESKLSEASKPNQIGTIYLVDHLQTENSTNLSVLLSKSIDSLKLDQIKLASIEDTVLKESSLILHLIDLCNLYDKDIFENEYYSTNILLTKLVDIFNQFKSDHILMISLPSLYTRYLVGIVYTLTCAFKQFTISPFYLRNYEGLKSSLVLVFTNESNQNVSSNEGLEHSLHLLKKLNDFNFVEKNRQLLDFIGIHNLMENNIDLLKLIIHANNINLIEKIKAKMNLN